MSDNIQITLKDPQYILATEGTYCDKNIEINAALQEKSVASPGEVAPDEDYIGLTKVSVDIPTYDGETHKFGQLTSSVGTWMLNETIPSGVSAYYEVSGEFININVPEYSNEFGLLEVYPDGYVQFSYGDGNRYVYCYSNSQIKVASPSSDYYFDATLTNRTFTIIGGGDANNSDLITWLEANAVKQS